MFDPVAESMPVEERRAQQTHRLRAQVTRLKDINDFYHRQLADVSDDITIEDLGSIPTISKPDLWDQYPLKAVAVRRSQLRRIHATSGTSGRPTIVAYTENDLDIFRQVNARVLAGAGAGPGTMIHNGYGYGLFTGGLGLHGGAEALGANVVPISGGNTVRQVQLIMDLEPEVLVCTPSYAATIADALAEKGVAPEENSLRAGIFGAEPWSESMRAQLSARLGLTALDIYGLCEVVGPGVAFETAESDHKMYVNEDHFYVECIDPETGAEVADGEVGELVFTTLTKEALPVLRYRTGDLAGLYREPDGTGRTLTRMSRILGRRDDMIVIRGVNVYPSEIEAVLLADESIGTSYAIVIDQRREMPSVLVLAEPANETLGSDVANNLGEAIAGALKQRLGVSCSVRVVGVGELPRIEIGKAVRVHRWTAEHNPLPDVLS
ncbi:MAG: phenylacetate--CoA ligase [Actinomycetota bacterium]|nr:phenylacetate--CoA ligase [Actinomycetota bacterium]